MNERELIEQLHEERKNHARTAYVCDEEDYYLTRDCEGWNLCVRGERPERDINLGPDYDHAERLLTPNWTLCPKDVLDRIDDNIGRRFDLLPQLTPHKEAKQ